MPKWLKFIVALIFGGPLVGIILWYAITFLRIYFKFQGNLNSIEIS